MERENKRNFLRDWTKKIFGRFGQWSADARFDDWRKLGGYCLLAYLVDLAITLLFLTQVKRWNMGVAVLMLVCAPVYALVYTAAAALPALIAAAALTKLRRARLVVSGCVGAFFFGATQLLLLADFALFRGFGYHFNRHVWNLLRTPGGFKSMGLRSNTIITLALAIVVGFALNALAMYLVLFFRRGAAALRLYGAFRRWRKFALLALAAAFFFAGATIFAWNFYMKYPDAMRAYMRFPGYQRVTMQKFFRTLRLREPTREELLLRNPYNGDNYPVRPIRRRADRKKYNVVWLACESWRADMLTPEVMPRTWSFAEKYGVRFTRNFSGGNNTRMGIFSMFYGLYGSYWHPFLDVRRGALLLDWMIEDGYDIECFTSAKFSYPEFEHTVFAKLPASALHSYDEGRTYARDARNIKLFTDFIARDRRGRPFMAFMFFESPHYPYEFPDENAVFKPFVGEVDFIKLGPSRAAEIKNRYRNCCRTLDGFLGQVFGLLEKRGMLDDTIVVVVGDHGEEIFEHGKLGHGQNFTNEQTRTPLVIHLPGVSPRVYDGMSSHLDIPAMLAPFFGVENPASDFSHGINLLAPGAPAREYTVITQWDESFFTGRKYKIQLPLDEFSAITAAAYDAEDREIPTGKVYAEYHRELAEVLKDLARFIK